MVNTYDLIAIHQPEHLPWLGFFDKMSRVDAFVLLDNVQFAKNYFQNRNRICGASGTYEWLTIPVQSRNRMSSTLRDVLIFEGSEWRRKYQGRFLAAYGKCPHFELASEVIGSVVSLKSRYLLDFNIELIERFRSILSIETPLLLASDLSVSGAKSELILSICQSLGARRYLSGPSGRNYLSEVSFAEGGVSIEYHEYLESELEELSDELHFLSTIHHIARIGLRTKSLLGAGSAGRTRISTNGLMGQD